MADELPGKHIYRLLKSAEGKLVPLSHIAAVTKIPEDDCIKLCDRLVSIGKAAGRYIRNGDRHELHYVVGAKK